MLIVSAPYHKYIAFTPKRQGKKSGVSTLTSNTLPLPERTL
jgi:hypothetical protein